ncbi:hypothetical protein ABK040_005739 [Willaertia magna]
MKLHFLIPKLKKRIRGKRRENSYKISDNTKDKRDTVAAAVSLSGDVFLYYIQHTKDQILIHNDGKLFTIPSIKVINTIIMIKIVKTFISHKLYPGDIVVMDNLRCHHNKTVKKIFEDAGINIVYTPSRLAYLTNSLDNFIFASIKNMYREWRTQNLNIYEDFENKKEIAIRNIFNSIVESETLFKSMAVCGMPLVSPVQPLLNVNLSIYEQIWRKTLSIIDDTFYKRTIFVQEFLFRRKLYKSLDFIDIIILIENLSNDSEGVFKEFRIAISNLVSIENQVMDLNNIKVKTTNNQKQLFTNSFYNDFIIIDEQQDNNFETKQLDEKKYNLISKNLALTNWVVEEFVLRNKRLLLSKNIKLLFCNFISNLYNDSIGLAIRKFDSGFNKSYQELKCLIIIVFIGNYLENYNPNAIGHFMCVLINKTDMYLFDSLNYTKEHTSFKELTLKYNKNFHIISNIQQKDGLFCSFYTIVSFIQFYRCIVNDLNILEEFSKLNDNEVWDYIQKEKSMFLKSIESSNEEDGALINKVLLDLLEKENNCGIFYENFNDNNSENISKEKNNINQISKPLFPIMFCGAPFVDVSKYYSPNYLFYSKKKQNKLTIMPKPLGNGFSFDFDIEDLKRESEMVVEKLKQIRKDRSAKINKEVELENEKKKKKENKKKKFGNITIKERNERDVKKIKLTKLNTTELKKNEIIEEFNMETVCIMNYSSLQYHCKRLGLKAIGKKEILKQRLIDHIYGDKIKENSPLESAVPQENMEIENIDNTSDTLSYSSISQLLSQLPYFN